MSHGALTERSDLENILSVPGRHNLAGTRFRESSKQFKRDVSEIEKRQYHEKDVEKSTQSAMQAIIQKFNIHRENNKLREDQENDLDIGYFLDKMKSGGIRPT